MNNAEKSRLIFQTIGWPIGTGTVTPQADTVEEMTEFAFKNRVGLLFLDECLRRGVALGPKAIELHESLTARRAATDRVVAKLARRLDEVAENEWVLFKSIKPFASTPNDTDWFPFDPRHHKELVAHLIADGGFKWMEEAPRQVTLIEEGGEGITDHTKKGGVYYIDCYVAPSTDYFIYLDPRRMRNCTEHVQINGYAVPTLKPHAELAAILFHNVFPEKTFTIESYYLIKCYLDSMEARSTLDEFIGICRDQKVEYASAANLVLAREIDNANFGLKDSRITHLLAALGYEHFELAKFNPIGSFPYAFPTKIFWQSFFSKQRDKTSFLSTLNQALHMLSPFFFVDVVRIIWRRTVKGGVYEQN